MVALTDIDRDRLITEVLGSYLFSKVWNEVVSERRTNIKPLLLSTSSHIGSVSLLDKPLRLPDSDPYYVWCIASEDMSLGLDIPSNRWVTTAEVTDACGVLIHMYHSSGVMLSKSQVHLRYNLSEEVLYVAVNKDMYRKMLRVDELDQMYITFYYDSDGSKDIFVKSHVHDAQARDLNFQKYELQKFLSSAKRKIGVTIYLNGIESTNSTSSIPAMNTGDYLDIIIDDNVLFAFDVDVTNTSEDPVFLSKMDSTWKQIIHIPKELNPDNKLYTYNTMDFFVRRTFSTDGIQGLYMHSLAGTPGMSQITHNDIGIGLFALDAHRDRLGTNEVTIHVKVREHGSDNKLIDEASYLKLLYTQDDQYIVDMLRSKHEITEITWWKAEELEASGYTKAMHRSPTMREITHVKDYVDALGFYKVVDLISHRVQDSIVTDAYAYKYNYIIPILYRNQPVVPLTYVNGKLLSKDLYTHIHRGDGTIDVALDKSLVFRPGDMFTTIMYLDNPYSDTSYIHTPTSSNLTMQLSHPYFDAYITSTDDVMNYGIAKHSRTIYTKLVPSLDYIIVEDTETPGKYIFRPDAGLLERKIILHPQDATYHERVQIDTSGANIVIPLEVLPYKTTTPVSLVEFNNISVYMNGDYLVRDMDYTVVETKNEDGKHVFTELVIQTMDHFTPDNGDNYVEYVLNMAEIADSSAGYLINDTFIDESPVNLFFENTSILHCNGRVVRDASNTGVSLKLPEGKYPQVSKTEVQTALPAVVTDFVEKYISDTDTERRRILNKYFIEDPIPMPDTLVLEYKKHRVYSTFVNQIIYDLVTGKLEMVEDPDIYRVDSELAPYMYLKEHDIVFNNRNADPLFTDWYPQYVTYEISPEMRSLIDRLIRLLMPKNELPVGDVVYDNGIG